MKDEPEDIDSILYGIEEQIKHIHQEIERWKAISDNNASELTNAINHILGRLRVVEERHESLH